MEVVDAAGVLYFQLGVQEGLGRMQSNGEVGQGHMLRACLYWDVSPTCPLPLNKGQTMKEEAA